MNESGTRDVEFRNQDLLVRRHMDKAAWTRRVRVAILLVYYILILAFAWLMSGSWWWSLEEGLMWSSGGPGMFFPIPFPSGMLGVETPAYLVDQVFYLVFMHGGIWIAWIALGLLYLFSPYRIDLHLLRDRFRTRFHDRG